MIHKNSLQYANIYYTQNKEDNTVAECLPYLGHEKSPHLMAGDICREHIPLADTSW